MQREERPEATRADGEEPQAAERLSLAASQQDASGLPGIDRRQLGTDRNEPVRQDRQVLPERVSLPRSQSSNSQRSIVTSRWTKIQMPSARLRGPAGPKERPRTTR
jgi:hypothetical protein